MKKNILATAVLCAVAGTAHAQSSVTLYGILDEGINFNSNSGGHRQYAMASGLQQGERWGLRGVEDLGGGLQTIFQLESGFNDNTGALGQGGLLFGRQAFVGLSSPYGAVTVGRQYDSVVDYIGPLQLGDQWAGGLGAHPGDIDNSLDSFRVNNALKYKSPNWNGFSFDTLYSLGGVAGQFSRNQIFSAGVGYNHGPINAGLAYLNVRDPNVSFFGNSTTSTPTAGPGNMHSVVDAGFGSANTYQVIAAAAAYTIAKATIGLTYSNVKFMELGSAYASPYAGRSETFNDAEVNFKYQVTPSLIAGVAYDYLRGGSIGTATGGRYQQMATGIDYFLSKRTDVYVYALYQHATGTTLDANGKTVTATADIYTLTPSANSKQAAVRIGIRHKF